MSECGVCKEIFDDFDEGLECDGGCTKWYHCICVGIPQDQYSIYLEDNSGDNKLKWFCDSCKDQDKETTQRETFTAWGKMKDIKQIKKVSIRLTKQLLTGKKTKCKSQEEKMEKH